MADSNLVPIQYLTRDLRASAAQLGARQARYLVDLYYQSQDVRIRARHQERTGAEAEEPCALVSWAADQWEGIEGQIKGALGVYAKASPVGAWSLSILGVGPVIAAGLLCHIEIEKAPTVGHIWRFAGLDPTVRWEKGQKRPWNAALKRLCWILGGSFVKFRSNEKDFYGALYAERKALELARNEAGQFRELAERSLKERTIRDKELRETYEAGRLPLGRLDLRARRWAVKIFLAHWHHVAYEVRYGEPPPKPYVLSQLQHGHEIRVPNWPI